MKSDRDNVVVGDLVALRMAKYDDEIPQIARVIVVEELDVTVEWLIGRYHDTWKEWKTDGTVVTESLPRNAIIKRGFSLTKAMRLTGEVVSELKLIYNSIELI